MAFLRMVLAALTISTAASALAAPAVRPFTGIGVVAAVSRSDDGAVAVYREPGVERVATLLPDRLPPLPSLPGFTPGRYLVIVLDKKGEWMRIAYDDAGRSGWFLPERPGMYRPWEDFLKGRAVKMLPGLKKNLYLLYQEPREVRPGDATVAGKELRVVQVQDDWCLVITGSGTFGWVRWRDGDGRLTVTVGRTADTQNN